MDTPILTKHQQKHSLSAKKGSIKKLRNVLAQPQDNYWPIVDEEKCPLLEEILNKLLPTIKRPSKLIPWSQLKKLKKEERVKAKKEALQEQENVSNSDLANSVVLGINAITRSLEKNNICCILMDANISPPLLIRHIIHMAQNKKVPVLLLPKLKTVTLKSIGFASAACALKNVVIDSTDHYFHPLYITICDIFKDVPLPSNRLQLFKDTGLSEETISDEKDNKISVENESQVSLEPIKFTVSADVYMYRSSRKERSFVPPSTKENSTNKPIVEETMEQNDFISLTKYNVDELDTSIKKNTRYTHIPKNKNSKKRKIGNISANVKYLPLKVKRLQGNVNRIKATKVSKHKK
ncbi:uncharacterized protein LOC122530799 isoform X2 [Frieseomelitta varia]|uniref:uncharacterized protein LOC122530799 isoform X2 n=1 Tax=Frieseomelitta varia TaxID=561572 RepID=UPI001CB69945|nr:uncharacterized protein LOC122530799 isoform X2 [Frieseomelitta varia]